MTRGRLVSFLAIAYFLTPPLSPAPAAQIESLAPYVPTPPDVVVRMLELAGVTAEDVVYDLGSGDGRILIAAARRYGARGVGVDIDTTLVATAEANAKAAGVADLVTFRVQDLLTVDLTEATVVTLYLVAAANAKLRPRLMRELPPGARIVAHDYPVGDWAPHVVDTFRDATGTTRTLYLWRIGG